MNNLFQRFLQLWRRLLSLLRRGRCEREMEEEMRFHLEMQIEQNLASGMAAEEARYAARRQFGNQTWLDGKCFYIRIAKTAEQFASLRRRGTGKKSDAPPRRRKDTPYLNLKNATCSLPSFKLMINWRHVPAHDSSVFQT